jgi:hypothetical protein
VSKIIHLIKIDTDIDCCPFFEFEKGWF